VSGDAHRSSTDKAERRAARELIGAYHQEQLRSLLEHVRAGFVRLDAGDSPLQAIGDRTVEVLRVQWGQVAAGGADPWILRERGGEPDWWQAGAASRRSR
jgi:hypothetical protein